MSGTQSTLANDYLWDGSALVKMLQGPVVELVIGPITPTSKPATYFLPQKLIVFNSAYLKDQITKLTVNHSTVSASRSISTPPAPVADSETSASTTSYTPRIHLATIFTPVFDLFLTFLYQGSCTCHYPRILHVTSSNALFHASAKHPLVDPTTGASLLPVPLPIQSWALGSLLGAPTFMNHCMTHIYRTTGQQFSLTPALVGWVWANTVPEAQLRRFVLDVLSQFWSCETGHVAKVGGLAGAWAEVFDGFEDLRRGFIFGLQGRRVRGCWAYFVGGPVLPAATKQSKAEEVVIKKADDADVRGVEKPALPLVAASAPAPLRPLTTMPFGPGSTA